MYMHVAQRTIGWLFTHRMCRGINNQHVYYGTLSMLFDSQVNIVFSRLFLVI
jgi:hypothetical protein